MPDRAYRIASLPGDGIGPEVVREGLRVLDAAQRRFGLKFEIREHSIGAAEYLRSGDPFPEAVFEDVAACDAILLGAMGLPEVRGPGGTEIAPQLDLRERLDLFAGVRPLYLYNGAHTPLKGREAGSIDFVIVRENTEGLFSTRKQRVEEGARQVSDAMLVTRAASERLFHAAFELARERRRHVTLVDKANVLPSMAFFRRVFDEVAERYAEVETRRLYVDAAALLLVRRPEDFDVLVTENMFGDILSDLGAALVGGMGVAPSGDLGAKHAVFQPSHGSAPDIAGRGTANPAATILSVAMMLEWLPDESCRAAGRAVQRAVKSALAWEGAATPDLGGRMSTGEMGAAVVRALEAGA
jgi:3-isopropylmalate dehydrogenase